MNKHFKYIILFSFLLYTNVIAQTCNYCGNKITSNYTTVEGLNYHPEHFICRGCGKSIEGSYSKYDGKYFHQGCYQNLHGLKCDFCKKPIEGSFVDSQEGKFHPSCFNNNVVKKCDVCSKPIIGAYIVDVHNLKYHKEHQKEFPICSNCNRIISEKTTNGGIELEDKRALCKNCFDSRIKSRNEYNTLLSKTLYNLSLLGLKIEKTGITIQPVNKVKLAQVSGNSVHANTKGFCQSNYKFRESNGKKEKIEETHEIYVLDRLPQQFTESFLVHELMHVWFHQNIKKDLPDKIVEGSCNFLSYYYMKNNTDKNSKEIILLLEKDPNEIYGNGFRTIKERFGNKNLLDLLTYLKQL